jgi:hypothetical protein
MFNRVQKAAQKILIEKGWKEMAILAALAPTPAQASERCAITVAPVNPEQSAAIKILHDAEWGPHSISQAMPVTEADIARVIMTKRQAI